MAPRRMISSGRAGLRCRWEPDTKRASGEARFFVQSPQGARSPIFELGDSARLKSPISRPSQGTETVSIGDNVSPLVRGINDAWILHSRRVNSLPRGADLRGCCQNRI